MMKKVLTITFLLIVILTGLYPKKIASRTFKKKGKTITVEKYKHEEDGLIKAEIIKDPAKDYLEERYFYKSNPEYKKEVITFSRGNLIFYYYIKFEEDNQKYIIDSLLQHTETEVIITSNYDNNKNPDEFYRKLTITDKNGNTKRIETIYRNHKTGKKKQIDYYANGINIKTKIQYENNDNYIDKMYYIYEERKKEKREYYYLSNPKKLLKQYRYFENDILLKADIYYEEGRDDGVSRNIVYFNKDGSIDKIESFDKDGNLINKEISF